MTTNSTSVSVLKPMNPSTRKLIRLRCEGGVRGRLLRWSGLPIGGTGAVAFFITLLVWIPQQLQDMDIGDISQYLLRTYVQQVATGNTEFREQLDLVFRSTVMQSAEKEIVVQLEHMSKEKVEKSIDFNIKNAISKEIRQMHRHPAMEAIVKIEAIAALQSNGYGLIRSVLKPELEIIEQRVTGEIIKNSDRAIQTVATTLPRNQIIDKQSYQKLRNIIDDIKSQPPQNNIFALRFYMAAGTGQTYTYDYHVIRKYIEDLESVLQERFRYALILDSRGGFVALSDIGSFKTVVENHGQPLQSVINDEKLALPEAKRQIGGLIGRDTIEYVLDDIKIKDALKNEPLNKRSGPTGKLDRPVAVVRNISGIRTFQGVTSRRKLIEALLP